LDITSFESATQALKTVDAALSTISSQRAKFGAIQSRFESTISNLESTSTNLSAAQSRILDADFAAETAKLSKAQVLQQAGISVLAQANARPQQVLSLLQ
jgi:flagellin